MMHYQEAIKEAEAQIDMYEAFILYNKDFEPKNDNSNYEFKIDFLKTAISAMQELQMYKDNKLSLIPEDVYKKQCEELDEYKKLGTLEEVRKAVEKQDPKKVKYMTKEGKRDIRFNCPNCATTFVTDKENEVGYCTSCGQKMDWSEQKK